MPAYTVGAGSSTLLLVSTQARVSYAVTTTIEPYVELGLVRQIAGTGDIQPPLWITPGVRFHVGEYMHPAAFFSMNFEEATALVFGLDLAAVFRPAPQTVDPDAMDDFLQDDAW